MTNEQRKKLLDEVDQEVTQACADDVAKLTAISENDLKTMLPADLDKEQMEKLMAIVGDETRSNEKKAKAINAIAGLSEIAVNLAAKIAKT